ncbi:N-6 DNA methylase [Nocardioides xinjiangensis]|uniref:N-6 DNA methylase n=1 Tax=Nocardioides xinjiangensis TaxID=2817376 RepID=UPI001B3054F1|nr:N-6 DNA methylase [Nocardioides sp. SYSU D00778]
MSPDQNPPRNEHLITSSEIANLAGVQRPTVSNWRRRNVDFPPPVAGSSTSPLFDRREVDAWLATKGYSLGRNAEEESLWRALSVMRDAGFGTEELVDMALTVATARRLSDESASLMPPWQQIVADSPQIGFGAQLTVAAAESLRDKRWSDLADVPTHWINRVPHNVVAALVLAVDQIDPADLGDVTDRILARLNTTRGRGGFEFGFVGSRTSKALANMVEFVDGPVYDPACGIGEALLQVAKDHGNDDHFVGHEVNADAARTAQQRFLLHGVQTDVVVGDVLAKDPDPALKARHIVLEPPIALKWEGSRNINDPRWRYGIPPASSADFAWIQHCLAHLEDGGRAHVITAMGSLFRGGQEGAIRSELIRHGCVDAIVALPGKMHPGISVPLALWMLCPPGDANDDTVLLVDGSDVPDAENHVRRWMALGGGQEAEDDPPWAVVPYAELLSSGSVLTPRRWIGEKDTDTQEIRRLHHAARHQVASSASLIGDQARRLEEGFTHAAPTSQARLIAMRDLIAVDAINVRTGRQRSDEGGPLSVITPRDVRSGALASLENETPALGDSLSLNPDLTRPGDVLVTTMNGIHAMVDHQGGHAIGIGVQRVRVSQPDQILPEYLAAALVGSWNERFQTGHTVPKADLKSLEIPVLPLADQQRLVDAITALRELGAGAIALQAAAEAAARTLLEAVRFNVELDPSEAPE